MSCRTYIKTERPSATAVIGNWDAHGPLSTLPLTATTGATAHNCSMIPGLPTSPAWIIRSDPFSAVNASGRKRPCVSEMSPTIAASPTVRSYRTALRDTSPRELLSRWYRAHRVRTSRGGLPKNCSRLSTRRETVIAVAFDAVLRVAALETCIPWVLPVTGQTLAVLPTPASRKISAPFRLGFADLAVISERWVHCRVSNRRMLNLQSGTVVLNS